MNSLPTRNTPDFWTHIRNIKPEKIASPDEPGSEKYVHTILVTFADDLITLYGGTATSGYRSEKHNKDVGGTDDSSHKKGLALDIDWNGWDSHLLYNIIRYIMDRRIVNRIVIYTNKHQIHIDMDTAKKGEVLIIV